MLNSRRTKLFLVSLLLSGVVFAEPPIPSVCKGHPLNPEEQLASAEAASKCDGMSPACERIPNDSDDLIFVGTVTKLTEAPSEMYLDGACAETTAQTVTLVVKESFSGSLPQAVTVHAGYINGHWFKVKETALVFAKKMPDGTFFVSGCQTEPIANWSPTAKDDLAYLRSRDKLPPTGRLMGYVWLIPPPPVDDKAVAVGFGPQSLTIAGPVSEHFRTSKDGEFRLDGLAPGKYAIHLDSSLPTLPSLDQAVELLPKGCAEVRFYIESEADYKRIMSAMLKAGAKK